MVALVAAWAYWICHGRPLRPQTAIALAMLGVGAMAAYDGIVLLKREYRRTHDGRVASGVVLDRISPTEAEDSPPVRRPRWRRRTQTVLTTEGFKIHDVLGRIVLTGSPRAWIVEYRYGCGGPYFCRGRDVVPESLWRRLQIGQAIEVRVSMAGEDSPRLDDNPRWAPAAVSLAFGAALLLAAGVISNRVTGARRRYLTAPAVVTAIEPVRYGDATRWRVRFAYFDPQGAAQESADELQSATVKPGDGCLAVFTREHPDLATFRAG